MDDKLTRSGLEGGALVEEENRVDESDVEQDVGELPKVGNKRKIDEENISNESSSPSRIDTSTVKQDDQLGSAKVEINEVREENDRLKKLLDRIMKDYQSLQMHLFDIVQQEQQQPKKPRDISPTHEGAEESELLLTLGRREHKREEKSNVSKSIHEEEDVQQGLALGLDFKFEVSKSSQLEHASNTSPENSADEPKKDETGEQWQTNKVPKTVKIQDDEPSQHTIVKKTRVSVRARCDSPTMNDGCQWRKYGQKTAKGNPCPRAYYRCTVAPACPVRKQVQRSVEDMSILITTYEGTHNHPLPISASAMASTTSAAASMLMSGSSSSSRSPLGVTNTVTSDLHRLLNFNPSHNNSRSSQFYLPTTPFISSSPSHPTITLDLTAPSSSSSLPSNFPNKPRYSSPSFNFSSSESNTIPTSWSNVYSSGYGAQTFNKSPLGSYNLGRQTESQHYNPYMQKNNPPFSHDTIAAATKVITSDPSFRSALTAAITSIVGNGGATGMHGNQNARHNEVQNLLGPNRSSSSSSPPQGNIGFLPPSLPLTAMPPEVESRDKLN